MCPRWTGPKVPAKMATVLKKPPVDGGRAVGFLRGAGDRDVPAMHRIKSAAKDGNVHEEVDGRWPTVDGQSSFVFPRSSCKGHACCSGVFRAIKPLMVTSLGLIGDRHSLT